MTLLNEIWDDYELLLTALSRERKHALQFLQGGSIEMDPRYFGLSHDELEKRFEKLLTELDHHISLVILANAEAAIRIDFQERTSRKLKDSLSRACRNLLKSKSNPSKVALEKEILIFWKEHRPEMKNDISKLKAALRYRHWLAHGRYWPLKVGENFDPTGLFAQLTDFFAKADLLTGK